MKKVKQLNEKNIEQIIELRIDLQYSDKKYFKESENVINEETNHDIQNKSPRSDSAWLSELYDRIDPNSPTITIQKIDDTKKCIEVFNQFTSMKNDNNKIFGYIKNIK